MSCFIYCCDPGLAGNGWEMGGVIAKLLSKGGTAENAGEGCFHEDAGLALLLVRLQHSGMLPPAWQGWEGVGVRPGVRAGGAG